MAERLALASGIHFFIIFIFSIFAKVGFPDHRQIRVLEPRECLTFVIFPFNLFYYFCKSSFCLLNEMRAPLAFSYESPELILGDT